jgi:dTMP kinase
MNNYEKFRNKLIVFEGSDQTGKTSVAKLFAERLKENGIDTVFTFQPGDVQYGEHAATLRSFCKDKRYDFHPLSNLFLFLADRIETTSKVVQPALEAGKTVISDRWSYSTIAYQLNGKKLASHFSDDVCNWVATGADLCRQPDIVFYFPERINVTRDDDPNDAFDHETKEFFSRVNQTYDILSDSAGWIKVYPKESAVATLEAMLNG